jgi:hypothetical protein
MVRSRFAIFSVCAALAGALTLPSLSSVSADEGKRNFSARLKGQNEVPSISTTATGSFRARLSADGTSLHYTLSYSGLSATVTQAHIHLGEQHTNGGIMVFLCSGASVDPTGLAPTCPATEGTVEGDITTANIIQVGNPAAPPPGVQGIVAGEFEEFLTALRKGAGYANVHTTNFGAGEIRGQVR